MISLVTLIPNPGTNIRLLSSDRPQEVNRNVKKRNSLERMKTFRNIEVINTIVKCYFDLP